MNFKNFGTAAMLFAGIAMLSSCGSKKLFLDTIVPQEGTLSLVKITDENINSVVGNGSGYNQYSWKTSGYGGGKGLQWHTGKRLSVSPDGSEIAYISRTDNAPNIMIKRTDANTSSTQRTFRRAMNVYWGKDNRLYFNDNTNNSSTLGSVDAKKGSLVKQLTTNNNDWYPQVTASGKIMYFTRFDGSGPSVWSLNLDTNELTNCTRGYGAVPYGDEETKIICTRNSEKGNSEIWVIDLENGDETLLVSDSEKGFSDPALSPDGQWILMVGNSLSSVSKKQNCDIYAVRSDGTQLTQITYHPEVDCSPVWSPDGKYIYFISSRANKDRKYSIWKIANPLH